MRSNPACSCGPFGGPLDVLAWNAENGWRDGYGELAEGLFFFAEDLFGGQFAVAGETIVTFDPETGETNPIASSMEGWADAVLGDYEFLTGHPLVRDWQREHGALPVGHRLMPKVPFIANGAFDIANLVMVTDDERMRFGGRLARHVAELPDGQSFVLPYAVPKEMS